MGAITARTEGKPFRVALDKTQEELEADASTGVVPRMVLDMVNDALSGDFAARRWILSRAYPMAKDAPCPLPEYDFALSMTEQIDAIMKYLAIGRLTPSEATAYVNIIDRRAKVVEITEMVDKVMALEEKMQERGMMGET